MTAGGTVAHRGGMLNPKQKAFVREYLKDFNATHAAIRAGYKHPDVQGPRLLGHVGVQAELQRLREKAENNAVMKFDEACEILTGIARSCLVEYMDGKTGAIDIRQGNHHAVQEVTQVSCDKDGNPIVKIKLNSKVQAIDRLAKMLGWDAPTRLEHSGDIELSIVPPPQANDVADP